MDEEIGILALDQLVYQREGQGILEGLREVIPPKVEVFQQQTTAFGLLDFIEKHKHLIILDKHSCNYGNRTTIGEVEYWGHLTGGIPEDIVVIGMDSIQESIGSILECIDRWNNPVSCDPVKLVEKSLV